MVSVADLSCVLGLWSGCKLIAPDVATIVFPAIGNIGCRLFFQPRYLINDISVSKEIDIHALSGIQPEVRMKSLGFGIAINEDVLPWFYRQIGQFPSIIWVVGLTNPVVSQVDVFFAWIIQLHP